MGNKNHKKITLRRFLMFAACVLIGASDAEARDYDRVIAFGDSSFDTGNRQGEEDWPRSWNGRNTNGYLWIDHLARKQIIPQPQEAPRANTDITIGFDDPFLLPLTDSTLPEMLDDEMYDGENLNFAVGGATTSYPRKYEVGRAEDQPRKWLPDFIENPDHPNPCNPTNTDRSSAIATGAAFTGANARMTEGILTQICGTNAGTEASVVSGQRDGQVNEFFRRGGRFNQDDLVTIYIGGNSRVFLNPTRNRARDAIVIPAVAADDLADQVSDDVITGLRLIASNNGQGGGGAGTVLIMNFPLADPRWNEYFGAYNKAIVEKLKPLANEFPETNFIILDSEGSNEAVVRNADAYGFTNLESPCLSNGMNPVICDDPDSYFLWSGNTHSTRSVSELLAVIAFSMVRAEETIVAASSLSETSFWARRMASRTVLQIIRRAENAPRENSWGLIGDNDQGGHDDYDYSFSKAGFNYITPNISGTGLMAGYSAGFLFGDAQNGAISHENYNLQMDLFGGWRRGPLLLKAAFGADFAFLPEYRRTMENFSVQESGLSARSYSVAIGADYRLPVFFSGLNLTPSSLLQYVFTNVSNFREGYSPILVPLTVRKQEGSFLILDAELRAETKNPDSYNIWYHAAIGAEIFIINDMDDIRASFGRDHPTQGISQPIAAEPEKPETLFSIELGLTRPYTSTSLFHLDYHFNISAEGDQNHTVSVSFSF